MKKYDVVISFAGEDRDIAETINGYLKSANVRTFYDNDHVAELWGKNLGEHLSQIYSQDGEFCLMIISKSYVSKIWPRHERRAILTRMIRDSSEYVLPYMVDDTGLSEIPGMSPDIMYISKNNIKPYELPKIIIEKLYGVQGALGLDIDDVNIAIYTEACAYFLLKEVHSRCAIENPSYGDLWDSRKVCTWYSLHMECSNKFINMRQFFIDNKVVNRAFDLLISKKYLVVVVSDMAGTWYGLTTDGKEKIVSSHSVTDLFKE